MATVKGNAKRHNLPQTVRRNRNYPAKTPHGPYKGGSPGVGRGGVDYTGHGPRDSDKSHPIEDLGTFESTAYGPPWDAMNGTGTTAGGTDLSKSPHLLIVAVDPDVIPLGTILEIKPNPFGTTQPFKADDTGDAIQGKRIDFYDWRGRKHQLDWGRKTVHVYALKGYQGTGVPGIDEAGKAVNDAIDKVDSVGESLGDIADGIKRLFQSDFWVRVGKAILGAVGLLLAVVILGKAILGIDLPGFAGRFGRNARSRYSDWRLGDMEPPTPTERLRGRQSLKKISEAINTPIGDEPPF